MKSLPSTQPSSWCQWESGRSATLGLNHVNDNPYVHVYNQGGPHELAIYEENSNAGCGVAGDPRPSTCCPSSSWEQSHTELIEETNPRMYYDKDLVRAHPVLFPERRPPFFKEEDDRFAVQQMCKRGQAGRSYACDNAGCAEVIRFNSRAFPFDGQYVNKTWVKIGPEDLKQLWREKRIDATWHCTRCHKRKRSNSETWCTLRQELGVYRVEQRQKRSCPATRKKGSQKCYG